MNSMTGFVFDVIKTEQGIMTLSLRSLNHRYLDLFVKLPETFKPFEFNIRQLLQKHLKRGKVELALKFQPSAAALGHFSVNEALLNRFATVFQAFQQTIPNTQIELTRLLNWPGMLDETQTDIEGLEKVVLKEVKTIINKLLQTRRQEGEQLKGYIASALEAVRKELKSIKMHMKHAIDHQQSKLLAQLKQLEVDMDSTRLAQEVTLLVQKADITEEVNRIEAYLDETHRLIQDKGQMGRRLDFLMQELNRETNTICSKSSQVEITQGAIEMKVLIEQIREQAQNLE
jgi:uncharacterized protein (TIGR00255 family)